MERFEQYKNNIIEELLNNEELLELTRTGFCRKWTFEAANILHNKFPDATFEAREVDISEELQHTFLKISLPGQRSLICDGTGVEKHPPFFGYEEEAPEYLQNSRLDIINRLINPKV